MTVSEDVTAVSNGAVLAEQREHILLVTINRPDKRNAINRDVALGVGTALEFADTDIDTRVVVLTGAGDKAFCAGADLVAVAAGEFGPSSDPRLAKWGFAGLIHHAISKPIIAAVNGFALGGGSEIVLACDLVVAAESASFGLPEVKRGIFAGGGGLVRLPQQIPEKVAMEVILTGNPLTAQRAYELGLVNRVVPYGNLLDEAMALAESISENAPLSVQISKQIARGIVDQRFGQEEGRWAHQEELRPIIGSSEDAKEGPRAFSEKRAPQWQGR